MYCYFINRKMAPIYICIAFTQNQTIADKAGSLAPLKHVVMTLQKY